MRIVMLEKWEGACWDGCLANATASKRPIDWAQRWAQRPAQRWADSLAVLKAVRALNPAYIAAGALLTDAWTGKPVELHNDDGMPGVYVPDFGTEQGRALWMSEVEGWVASGLVDGIFADKWPNGASADKKNSSDWTVCNHVCGHVTPAQGLLYGDGCNGCFRKHPRSDGNLVGPWIKNWQFTPPHPKIAGQNVWQMIEQTREMLHVYNYSYVYLGCGDHNPSGGKPFHHSCADDLCTDCTPEGIAIFLLVVEEGVFLGSNGWDPAFDRPLGAPLGPAANVTDHAGVVVGLTRSF
eukprot:gene24608-27378_t